MYFIKLFVLFDVKMEFIEFNHCIKIPFIIKFDYYYSLIS